MMFRVFFETVANLGGNGKAVARRLYSWEKVGRKVKKERKRWNLMKESEFNYIKNVQI